MNRKILLIIVISIFSIVGIAIAADWSQYESGRNNIRLDGYQGQPGYIAFTDGNGNVLGYLYARDNSGVAWVAVDSITLSTTKLTTSYGSKIATGGS